MDQTTEFNQQNLKNIINNACLYQIKLSELIRSLNGLSTNWTSTEYDHIEYMKSEVDDCHMVLSQDISWIREVKHKKTISKKARSKKSTENISVNDTTTKSNVRDADNPKIRKCGKCRGNVFRGQKCKACRKTSKAIPSAPADPDVGLAESVSDVAPSSALVEPNLSEAAAGKLAAVMRALHKLVEPNSAAEATPESDDTPSGSSDA